MKRVLLGATIAAIAALSATAQAGTANNNFTVSTSLSSQCTATNTGTQTVDFGVYTAFQATPQAGTPVNLTFQCTRGFVPTGAAFDTGSGLGVLVGLQYTLTAGAPSTVAGTAATTLTIGTGDAVTYNVTGSMPAGQAGACVGSSCGPTTATRTLIVSF